MAAKMLKPSSLALFATQIGLFLRSGMSLSEGLSLMEEDVKDKRFGQAVGMVRQEIENRNTLSDAMTKAGCFPEYMVNMARIGETSGNLDVMMTSVSRFYEREQGLQDRVKSAVVYPLMLIFMMSLVVLLLIVRVLPMFADLLASLNQSMPGPVRWLMGFGTFVGSWYWLIIGCIVFLAAAWLIIRRTPGGAVFADRVKAGSPFTRRTYHKMMAERFAVAMSFLLSSHVDLDTALDLARDILGNRHMAKKIDECHDKMRNGETIYDALRQSGIFPAQFSRMLAIGFKSGEMDKMMGQLVDVYEQEVNTTLRRITGAIEPTFVAVLSVLVGFILISVMMPMLQIMSNIG